MSYLKLVLKIVASLILAIYLLILGFFHWSEYDQWQEILDTGTVVETKLGAISYSLTGEGPVVLILHGTPGGLDQRTLFSDLIDDGFSILAVSRPGYLRTPLTSGQSPAEQADLFAALLDELKIDKVAVFGGSGGVPSTIEFARRHPTRTWAAVMASGLTETLTEGPPGPPTGFMQFITTIFGEGFMDWAFLQVFKVMPENLTFFHDVYPDSWPRLLENEDKMARLVAMMETALGNSARRIAGRRNDAIQFSTLTLGDTTGLDCPTLVIHGTADTNAPVSGIETLIKIRPDFEVIWIENGDHMIAVSRDDEFRHDINRFLAQSAPKPK